MPDLPKITMYTDGACSSSGKRMGCGGWAAIILIDGTEYVRTGNEFPSTSQRMELQALLGGLKSLIRPCQVEFISDSEYLIKGVTVWMDNWKKKKWKTAVHDDVKNKELWMQIDAYRRIHLLTGTWVKGHIGPYYVGRTIHHDYNERCDKLAVAEAMKMHEHRLTYLAEGLQ